MSPTDTELMARIVNRDAAAFEEFASRHRDALLRHIRGIVHNGAAGDDVLQEALLRVWMRSDQWDGTGSPKAWLYRIATNLALNHCRAVGRRREAPIEAVTAESAASTRSRASERLVQPGPERQIEESDRNKRLRRLIGALPAAKRDVAHLVWEEEMELRTVAERLDIPEGTVKSRLHHARKWLTRQWNADENEGEDKP